MNLKELRANFLLLLTAAIWGFAFVAQKVGAGYLGAFAYNGFRFALGSLSLLPVLLFMRKPQVKLFTKRVVLEGSIIGAILFLASYFQQRGIEYTTVGNAGFITSLYIVLVPVIAIFLGQKTRITTWIGVICAVAGLYLLSIKGGFHMASGDVMVLVCAFLFSVHILFVDKFSKEVHPVALSCIQFAACAVCNLICAFLFETISMQGVMSALTPILYGGIMSAGVAYTLQIVAQKDAKPAHASVLMSLESVFSCLGGILILKETLGLRQIAGCILMFTGVIVSQIVLPKRGKNK